MYFECFRPVCEFGDAPQNTQGLLDILSEMVGKQKGWEGVTA